MADQIFHGSADRLEIKEATFAEAAAESSVVDISGLRVSSIRLGASWDAAVLAFSESPDDDDTRPYLPLHDDTGAEITIVVTISASTRVDEGLLAPYRFIKLRSIAAADGAEVPQTAERTIELECVPMGTF